jgi:hypothetical protein
LDAFWAILAHQNAEIGDPDPTPALIQFSPRLERRRLRRLPR